MTKLTDKIEHYCAEQGVIIPSGFYRQPSSRYVIIRKSDCGIDKKLVARTWFSVVDVINYIEKYCDDDAFDILDFKDGFLLERVGNCLNKIRPFIETEN